MMVLLTRFIPTYPHHHLHPPQQGPRMELFFYGLCSKAGYSNLSVVPAGSDTCDTKPGQLIGIGSVKTVTADVR